MKLLAFETATEACSVALWIDGDVRERFEIAPRRHAELALPWAEQLLAEAGIARSQLNAIAVGRGPGAFTGVRLAIAIAQGIALALDLPAVPISTLAALAASFPPQQGKAASLPPLQSRGGLGRGAIGTIPRDQKQPPPSLPLPSQGGGPQRILAAIDARMGEIYLGSFERSGTELTALSEECVVKPDAAIVMNGDWHGVGTGFAAGENALQAHLRSRLWSVDATALPHAADVARLGVLALGRGEAVAPERVEPAYLRNNVALTLAQQRELRANR